jgi:hypothetical protein
MIQSSAVNGELSRELSKYPMTRTVEIEEFNAAAAERLTGVMDLACQLPSVVISELEPLPSQLA